MRILISGGAGFIGSHVADACLEAGHRVAVVDSLCKGRREHVSPAAAFHPLDLFSPELADVFTAMHPEVVCHHAAQVAVGYSLDHPEEDATQNLLGSLRLLEHCRAAGVRKIIYASTVGVYGEPRSLPVAEDHPVDPLSPYAASKHAVEHYLRLYRTNWGLDYTVLRYANVYGPRQDPHGEAGVVAIFARRLLAGESTVINGTGEQTRDFVYVGDVVRGNLLALEHGSGEILNLGTGVETSINALHTLLAGLVDPAAVPIHAPAKEGEIFRIRLDCRRAEASLGWRPTVPLAEGLRRTVEFFRRHADGQG